MRVVIYWIIGVILFVAVAVGIETAGLTWYAPWKADRQTEITVKE